MADEAKPLKPQTKVEMRVRGSMVVKGEKGVVNIIQEK